MIVNKKSIYIIITLLDFLLFNGSFIAAALIAQPSEMFFQRSYIFILLLTLNVFWIFYTNSSGFYEEFLTRPFPIHLFNILKLTLIIIVISILVSFFTRESLYTRTFILLSAAFLILTITSRTIFLKWVLKAFRLKGKSVRNLLIIGTDGIGQKFRDIIVENPEIGFKFIGFISDVSTKDVIGNISNMDDIIIRKHVEEVVIALPDHSNHDLDEIIRACNKNAVRVHIIPDYFKFLSSRFRISTVSNIPVITLRDEPLNEVIKRVIKRSFDILFSLLISVLIISWLFPILAMLIKLDSKGPVLFIQERFGVKNKRFKCFKFRTMVYDNDNHDRFIPVFNGDSRITRIGNFLRKTNIDEIPQFLNVLKGDMSVVGPRPHAVSFDLKYEKIFEDIKMRYSVRPGITGWAQINGLRGDVENEEENKQRTMERMKYDLWYIENWSFKLDFQIILITIWHMIKGDTKGI